MTLFARAAALSLLAGCMFSGAAGAAGARTDESPTLVVYFADWSGKLDHAALDVIAHAAKRAKKLPSPHILVAAYADNTGSKAADLALTQLRAQRVADLLESHGVPESEITMKAEGAQKMPGVASRRVEITLSGD
jgi:outer membrane protein OmpA-like peptidoglycan-associated protein